MRTLNRNKRKLYYSNLVGTTPVYKLDSQGNKIVAYTDTSTTPPTIYYEELGYKENVYSTPAEYYGNIVITGGDSLEAEFGVSLANYSAVLVVDKGSLPITETSLVWFESTPNTNADNYDYTVGKVVPGLDSDRFLLNKVVK